jgi:competence ComEA-like helix-hairpin-helix protein
MLVNKQLTKQFTKTFALVFGLMLAFAGTQGSLAAAKKATAAVKQTEQQIPVLSVNINKATAEEMAEILNGVGLKKAELIVTYRTKYGEFKQLEDLLSVKGIGESTLAKNRHKIKLQ